MVSQGRDMERNNNAEESHEIEDCVFEHQDFLKQLALADANKINDLLEQATTLQLYSIICCVRYCCSVQTKVTQSDKSFYVLCDKFTSRLSEDDRVYRNALVSFIIKYFDCIRPMLCVGLTHLLEEAFVCISSCI